MFCFFGHPFSFVLRGFFRIFLILIMVGVSHMFQNEKFAAVELAKAGQGHKQIATQLGRGRCTIDWGPNSHHHPTLWALNLTLRGMFQRVSTQTGP